MEYKRTACVQKVFFFLDFFNSIDADFFCIQESKLQAGQIDLDLPAIAVLEIMPRKGYSSTAISPKCAIVSVSLRHRHWGHDREGRVITLEYDQFLSRNLLHSKLTEWTGLPYRMRWDDDFREYLKLSMPKACRTVQYDHRYRTQWNRPEKSKTNRKNAGFQTNVLKWRSF